MYEVKFYVQNNDKPEVAAHVFTINSKLGCITDIARNGVDVVSTLLGGNSTCSVWCVYNYNNECIYKRAYLVDGDVWYATGWDGAEEYANLPTFE